MPTDAKGTPTPRPWRVSESRPYLVYDATGRLVADCSGPAPEETGALVVRAVNAHDALVAALRKCLDYIPGSEVRSWPPGFRLKKEALEAARAALAAAREGT